MLKPSTSTIVNVKSLPVVRIDSDTGTGVDTKITGEYWVEEYLMADASMHIFEPLVYLATHNDPFSYEVTADDLWRHINPEQARSYDISLTESELHDLHVWLDETTDLAERDKIKGYIADAERELAKLKGEIVSV